MLLKDTRIKKAKPAEKAYKLADGEGLHLEVTTTGSKLWRLRYRLHGKESVYSIGKYPAVSLAIAREKRSEVKALIAQGINPSSFRKQEKIKQSNESRNTFKAVAEDWLERNIEIWTHDTYRQRENLLLNDIYPYIGSLPIRDILPAQILEIIQRIERRAPTMASIAQQSISAIYQLGVMTLRADADPTQFVNGIIKKRKVEHHKILKPEELADFLRAVDDYSGFYANHVALQMSVLTLARSNEVLQAAWVDIDIEKEIWSKPADKVKKREIHTVPLSKQTIELLKRLYALTGHREYLFPNRNNARKPASKGVLWKAFVSMGYKDKFTPHGLRGTGSTILNEMGYRPDIIEKQLDHSERNKTRASYNHAEYLDERRVMMQDWANYLDGLKGGADVVPIKKLVK